MTIRYLCERLRREASGGMPSDDSQMSLNYVASFIPDGLGYAAKQNYLDNLKIDGVAYLNNAFYTTYKNLTVSKDGNFRYKIILPSTPVGIGGGDDILTLEFVDSKGNVSDSAIVIPIVEYSYADKLRQPQNKIIASYQSGFITTKSTVPLWNYKAQLVMVSGGNINDLDSELNIPTSYLPVLNEYVLNQLKIMKSVRPDVNNDGQDIS